jgi:hypothetical protein
MIHTLYIIHFFILTSSPPFSIVAMVLGKRRNPAVASHPDSTSFSAATMDICLAPPSGTVATAGSLAQHIIVAVTFRPVFRRTLVASGLKHNLHHA